LNSYTLPWKKCMRNADSYSAFVYFPGKSCACEDAFNQTYGTGESRGCGCERLGSGPRKPLRFECLAVVKRTVYEVQFQRGGVSDPPFFYQLSSDLSSLDKSRASI